MSVTPLDHLSASGGEKICWATVYKMSIFEIIDSNFQAGLQEHVTKQSLIINNFMYLMINIVTNLKFIKCECVMRNESGECYMMECIECMRAHGTKWVGRGFI